MGWISGTFLFNDLQLQILSDDFITLFKFINVTLKYNENNVFGNAIYD